MVSPEFKVVEKGKYKTPFWVEPGTPSETKSLPKVVLFKVES